MMVIEHAIIIIHVHVRGQSDLFLIGETGSGSGLLAGLSEHGKENGSQNSDNGDNDKQLDECERAFTTNRACQLHDRLLSREIPYEPGDAEIVLRLGKPCHFLIYYTRRPMV